MLKQTGNTGKTVEFLNNGLMFLFLTRLFLEGGCLELENILTNLYTKWQK